MEAVRNSRPGWKRGCFLVLVVALATAASRLALAGPQEAGTRAHGGEPGGSAAASRAAASQATTPAGGAEGAELPALVVGTPAPALRVERWLRGEPVESFERGRVYVVEFWATWCGPCREAMPHLSALQDQYREQVTVVGVSVREGGPKDEVYGDEVRERVAGFVKQNEGTMRYRVAFDGGAKAARAAWMDAAGATGVPTAFIVDRSGAVAHIGHPANEKFEKALAEVVEGRFDLAAAAGRYRDRLRQEREFKRGRRLFEEGKVEEALAVLNALAGREPAWAATVAFEEFQSLMQARRHEAALALVPELVEKHVRDSSVILDSIATQILKLDAEPRKAGLELALKAARRAVEVNGEKYPVPPDTLAKVYWAMGNREEAIRWQKQAVEYAPADAKGNFEPALREYEGGR